MQSQPSDTLNSAQPSDTPTSAHALGDPPRSANLLALLVSCDPKIQERMKADPAGESARLALQTTQELPPPAREFDRWIYRIVVIALGLAVLSAIIGSILLAALKITPLPETLTAIGSASVGALAGLLAPSPAGRG